METATTIQTDARARTIASWWYDFRLTADPLYKFYTTGYIDGATAPRIEELIAGAEAEDVADLQRLLAYTNWHGHRQPVTGWADLPDEE